MQHTVDTLMALALTWRLAGSASRDEHEDNLRTALTEALAQPVRGRKVMSKAFCNPNQYDGEELAYNNDYLNE